MSDTDITEQTEEEKEVLQALVPIDEKSGTLMEQITSLEVVDDASSKRMGQYVLDTMENKKRAVEQVKPGYDSSFAKYKRFQKLKKKKEDEHDDSIKAGNAKIDEYDERERVRLEREAEERRKREEDERARQLGQLRAATEKLMKEAGSLDEKRLLLLEALKLPDIPEKHESGLRSQLRTIEAQIAEKVEKVEAKAVQAEEAVEAIPIAAPAIVKTHVPGKVKKKDIEVKVENPMALVKEIVAGKVPITVIGSWSMKDLKAEAKRGFPIAGVSVKTITSTHFRGSKA